MKDFGQSEKRKINKNPMYTEQYYKIVQPSDTPTYSFLGRPGADITSKNHLKAKKNREPGPGEYPDADVQFKKPVTKFGRDKRKGLADTNQNPGPDRYNPQMTRTDANFWKFPQDERFEDKSRGFVTPAPGMYETMRMPDGLKKSMLGEVIGKKNSPDNFPGPGAYLGPNIPKSKSVPGFKIKPPTHIKNDKNKGNPVGPQKYNPMNPTYTSYSWKMGTGQRGEIKTASNRIQTPGPAHDYNIPSQFEKKPRFSMGMRTK